MPPKRRPASLDSTPEVQLVETTKLFLDDSNPRITAETAQVDQEELLQVLWRDYAVDEIALSIASNGFFSYEPLFVAKEGGRFVVIEGNRRLAAVKLLRDGSLRRKVRATDLPKLTPAAQKKLDTLPVIVCARAEVWQHLGFKHINGPQAWESEAKSEYIAWVHDELGESLDDIARTIGDTNLTVQRLYRARCVLQQAEKEGVWAREDRWKKHFSFSHLYTGLNYSGLQNFLGLKGDVRPVPRSKTKELGELLVWMFGSKSRELPPIVKSQNPDLRRLDDALQSKNGVSALRRGMPLDISVEIAKGDERVFRQSIQGAKQSLQKASGTVLTGYKNEADLLETVEDIENIAVKLYEDMVAMAKRARRRRGK